MSITITDRNGEAPVFSQWETGRELRVNGTETAPELRFAGRLIDGAIAVQTEAGEDGFCCRVPDALLSADGWLFVSVVLNGDEAREVAHRRYLIRRRPKPADYAPQDYSAGTGGGTSIPYDAVTPEQYGAVGNGVFDDGPALKAALESGRPVVLTRDLYVFSKVLVYDHSVDLDGRGHTVHVDLAAEPVGWDNPFAVRIGARALPAGETGPLKIVSGSYRESIGTYRGVGDMGDSYAYGYISYKGVVPMPPWILEKLAADPGVTETYYPKVTVRLRDVEFRFRNCTGKFGLQLSYCVESVLDNVKSVCEYGHDGMEGISLNGCSDVRVEHCTCENWTHRQGWALMGTHGYGIGLSSDNVRVTDFRGINNRDHMAGGGNNGLFWGSRITVRGANLESDGRVVSAAEGRPDGYFEDGFESHGNCYDITYENVTFVRHHQPAEYSWAALFELRTPYATVKNVNLLGPGVVVFPAEFTEESYISHVVAPEGELRGYHGVNWRPFAQSRGLVVQDSLFRTVDCFDCATALKLINCVILWRVWNVSHLRMVNCTVLGDQDWSILSPVRVLEDALIVNCDLYHNGSIYCTDDTPLIDAPPNAVQAMNNLFRVLPGKKVFTTEQRYAVNNREQHRFGLILTSNEAILDRYYPFE